MKNMDDNEIAEIGANARKYYDENFERSYLFNRAVRIFEDMITDV